MTLIEKIKVTGNKVIAKTSKALLKISQHVSENSVKYSALALFGVMAYTGANTNMLNGLDASNLLITITAMFGAGQLEVSDFFTPQEDEEALASIFIGIATTLFISDVGTANAIIGSIPDMETANQMIGLLSGQAHDVVRHLKFDVVQMMHQVKEEARDITEVVKEYTDNLDSDYKEYIKNTFGQSLIEVMNNQKQLATIPVKVNQGI